MAIEQSGKAPPAVTPAGTTRDVSEDGAPSDLVAEGKSSNAKGGDRDFTRESRIQPTSSGQPPTAPWMQNRSQQVGGPMTRVNPKSVPDGGTFPNVPTKQATGTGSVGNGSKPFKVK